jgi:uncharacterized membrane protein YhiD involved in acid resistance
LTPAIVTDIAAIILRLGTATLIGAAIGLNRDLHVRTLGLVGLASARAALASRRAAAKLSIQPTPAASFQEVLMASLGQA